MSQTGTVLFASACVFVAVVAVIASRSAETKLQDLRLRGLYPPAGQASDADVRRLLEAGEKIMAIRCYREVHKVGLKDAKDAVDALDAANR